MLGVWCLRLSSGLMEQRMFEGLKQGRVLEMIVSGRAVPESEAGGRKEQKTLFQNPAWLSVGPIHSFC